MVALTLVLLACLASSAYAASYCDMAVMSTVSAVFGPECTPTNDTCPLECQARLEHALVVCEGENYTIAPMGDVVPFQAGAVAAGLVPLLSDGACREAPIDAVFNSTVYVPTCADGLLLFLVASGSHCGEGSMSDVSMCPRVCERAMDAVFGSCAPSDALDLNGTERSAAELVAFSSGLLSSPCSAALRTRTFQAEANGTTGNMTMVTPMPMPTPPPFPVPQTECDVAYFSAIEAVFSPRGLCAPVNDTCPMACRSQLENVFDTCVGGNVTNFLIGGMLPFPSASFAAVFTVALGGFSRPCQEVPIDVLVDSTTHGLTCQDGVEMLIQAALTPPCSDRNASACPEACELVVDAAFTRCEASDEVRFNGTEQTAAEVVAFWSTHLSSPCSASLGNRSFMGEMQTSMGPSVGTSGSMMGTSGSMMGTSSSMMSTSGSMMGTSGSMMGTNVSMMMSTTAQDAEDVSSSSRLGAALSATVLAVAGAALDSR